MEQNLTSAGTSRFYPNTGNGTDFFNDIRRIENALNFMTLRMAIFDELDEKSYISDAITYIYETVDKSRQTFVFSMFSQENVYFRESDAYDVLYKLHAANISVSVIADIDGKYSQGYVFDLITGTCGVLIEISDIVEAAEIQPAALSFNTSFPQLQAMSSMVTQITAVNQMAARLSSNDNFVGPPQHIALPTLRHIFGDNLCLFLINYRGDDL